MNAKRTTTGTWNGGEIRRVIGPVFLAATCLALSRPAAAAIVTSSEAIWPAAPNAQTVDVHGVATNSGGRNISGTRQIRQTFQVENAFTVEELFLSASGYDGSESFTIKLFAVDDIHRGSWSPGPRVGPTITVGAPGSEFTQSGGTNLAIALGADNQFFLPQRNMGTAGYGIELESVGNVSAFTWRHAHDGNDYAPGRYYQENGNGQNLHSDMGLALRGPITLDGTSGANTTDRPLSTNGGLTLNLGFFVDTLVVGGGGGSGGDQTNRVGGGGAGGLVFAPGYNVSAHGEKTEVVVGAGGAGGIAWDHPGSDGADSLFGTNLEALGGGGGGAHHVRDARDGGSGGGGRASPGNRPGGDGLQSSPPGGFGFGNSGGRGANTSTANNQAGGGGGGAGAPGQNGASRIGGSGGEGLYDVPDTDYNFAQMFGTAYGHIIDGEAWFAGGGGGTARLDTGGIVHGQGGKGGGGYVEIVGGADVVRAAMDNTGGGGSGGAPGASGIVIVRYQGPEVAGAGGDFVANVPQGGADYHVHYFTTVNTTADPWYFDLTGVDMNQRLGTTITSSITGDGDLTFTGPGTLTLAAENTYTGGTRVSAGTLHVTGSLLHNGSAHVEVASAGDAFGAGDPSIIRRVGQGGSFAGLGSRIAGPGTLGTTADLRAGVNAGGAALDVGMAWRTPNSAETAAFPPRTALLSDVLQLTGMDGGGSTDPFVLQMTYDPSLIEPYHDPIFLAWLDDTEWVNAVYGNDGFGSSAVANYAGSWTDFTGHHGSDLSALLGSWGVDTTNHAAWAVLNHNSQFAVLAIPEPGAALLLLSALACGLLVRRRRR